MQIGTTSNGEIRKYDIEPEKEIVVQKSALLANEPTVERSIFFNKKVMTGMIDTGKS